MDANEPEHDDTAGGVWRGGRGEWRRRLRSVDRERQLYAAAEPDPRLYAAAAAVTALLHRLDTRLSEHSERVHVDEVLELGSGDSRLRRSARARHRRRLHLSESAHAHARHRRSVMRMIMPFPSHPRLVMRFRVLVSALLVGAGVAGCKSDLNVTNPNQLNSQTFWS